MNVNRTRKNLGFTLVEMMVVAPIVILLIGGFIATIVSLTGEAMASRGANALTYSVQDALNRIEEDVKLSSTYLATNSVSVANTKQGYGGTTSTGSTVNFTNTNDSGSGGSGPSLILNVIATTKNPLSEDATFVYLKDQPNSCASAIEYQKNRPLTYNIVYFVDSTNTLLRRTIMPEDYADANKRCGAAPWQAPSCMRGYTSALTFCKTTDERLVAGVTAANFDVKYYPSASSETPNTTATNSAATVASRNAALLATPTVGVRISANQTVAGREVSYTGTLRATRLDTNATAIANVPGATAAPSAPTVSANVSDGHIVTFTWPQVDKATRYTVDYRIKVGTGAWGSWVTGPTNLSNANRSYAVSTGWHTDTVEARVRAVNDAGASGYATQSTVIPLWAPLPLIGGWTDYSAGWTPGPNTYGTAAFTRTKSGMVIVKGLIKKTPANTYLLGDPIAYLPPDYRPTGRLIFGSLVPGASPNARVDVLGTDGKIVMDAGNSSDWLSLDTIRFLAATAPYTRNSPTLLNGWENFGHSWAPASYTQDNTGRVFTQGLVKGGVMADNTPIFNMPGSYAPAQYHHISGQSYSYAQIGVSTTPSIVAKNTGSNSYMAVNTVYIPSSATQYSWSNLSLQNGWATYAGFTSPQYTKGPDGVVHLKGLIRSGATTGGTVIATLPAGFRPSGRLLYTTVNTAEISRIDINSLGEVLYQGTPSNTWLSMDNISFMAEK